MCGNFGLLLLRDANIGLPSSDNPSTSHHHNESYHKKCPVQEDDLDRSMKESMHKGMQYNSDIIISEINII